MSIRKRLLISNAAMVLMPIVIIILIIFLLSIVLGVNHEFNGIKHGWGKPNLESEELFNDLIRVSSIEQEKLYDSKYLKDLSVLFNSEEKEIIIRKGDEILFTSNDENEIKEENLPSFGNEGYDPVGWIAHEQFSIRQHDFYFQDGDEGTIFLLNSSASFVQFARTFFPIIFVSLIVILLLTNVLLSYFVSRSILRPVQQLSNASAQISKGNFNFPIDSTKKDELGNLVRSFDVMRRQLKESMELRDKYENNRRELIANISHDLKTPITSILGYVEGIRVGVANTPDKLERYLDTIHTKAKYINRLIEELFLYSKLDVKKLPFHFDAVYINHFIQDYLDDIKDELREKNVQLTFDANHVHSKVKIDRDKLIRVIENVIYNSVKYTDKNQCEISISLIDRKDSVEVIMSDNGPGVAETELVSIFNRFYQSDPSRQKGGSGLGLAIASQIMEAHEGRIWAENLTGGGLSVHFTLKKSERKGDSNE